MRTTWTISTLLGSALAATLAIGLVGCSIGGGGAANEASVTVPPGATVEPTRYPSAPRLGHVDTMHGVEVADPYRWLEDPDAATTRLWIERQNELSFGYLEDISERSMVTQRLTELWNYERWGIPFEEGGKYFVTRNDGLQDQSVLYVMDSLTSTPRVLIDPNTFSEDGTVSLAGSSVSDDGRLIAYSKSDGGSDWREVFVRDVRTGEDLDDHLKWVKFSGLSWKKDGSGFYYSRYDEPKGQGQLQAVNRFQKLFFHEIGTPQSEDRLIYHEPNEPEHGFGGSVTDDGDYLIISVWKGTERKNKVYYQDLRSESDEIVKLINEFEASFSFVGNEGTDFFFFTDLDAPRGRLIAIDTRFPRKENWRTVIPQTRDTLRSVNLVGDRFLASYLKDAHTQVAVRDLDGNLVNEVDLPTIGTAGGFNGDRDDTETFYTFTSFTTPGSIYRYDLATGESRLWRQPDVDFDADRYVTKQVFYRSKDGTKVPMFITHRKDIELDGQNPTLLYGYGGFNIPIVPSFSVSRSVWLEMGGVYAVANLRGGGEYGKEWHDAGRLKNKQNVFDDFIAAAEWLIDNDYTSTPKLAISGRSNGGLLVGAVMTQRPDLFGACLPGVGVLDMLRFHKFTIGWAWVSDYGSPDDPEMFPILYDYSPYHNLEEGTCYPPTLIITADRDDRVVPAHSFKFAAALQDAQSCENPVLIRIETRSGHGSSSLSKRIEEAADEMSFLVRTLGMDTEG